MINFETSPAEYRHWKLKIDGAAATLAMDVNEDETIEEGYKLKLNSYDLGVDIELADAVVRLRFEHPEVKAVVITSLKPRIFCAGANIYMLGASSHARKVNFCKFTNETRCAIEDDSRHSGVATSPSSTARRQAASMNWRWPATRSTWRTTARGKIAIGEMRLTIVQPQTIIHAHQSRGDSISNRQSCVEKALHEKRPADEEFPQRSIP